MADFAWDRDGAGLVGFVRELDRAITADPTSVDLHVTPAQASAVVNYAEFYRQRFAAGDPDTDPLEAEALRTVAPACLDALSTGHGALVWPRTPPLALHR